MIPPHLAWVWRAWHRLEGDRQFKVEGMAVPMGPVIIRSVPRSISFSTVDRYAERRGYSETRLDFLWRSIVAMEEEYLRHWHEKNPAK